jgi:hypothetical protein
LGPAVADRRADSHSIDPVSAARLYVKRTRVREDGYDHRRRPMVGTMGF